LKYIDGKITELLMLPNNKEEKQETNAGVLSYS
jgi:hypothetical protein